ncbi:MAG: arginine decarboxylase [Tepidanaerobacteraceae bacterium]|nr:arginine decarboxylase [Tepidanaerobacteraceae bacterium]
MRKKLSVPLLEKLIAYSEKDAVRFHVPGHKGGRGLIRCFEDLMKENLFRWDVTEIPGMDNYHEPAGAIERAQKLLSRLYGAEKSFFLVNGATSGIMAMLGAALKKGDKILLPRDSHKSALMGVILSGAKPVYLKPQVNEELGVAVGVPDFEWKEKFTLNPDAKAVFLTNPNYQGFCPDLSKIIKKARLLGMKVLVDEAHGAHLAFSDKLPPSAGTHEVDAWVQSPHKTLCSLTQSAWLHLKGENLEADELRSYLSLLTTTSPSYILMASLDLTRALMENVGKRWVEKGLYLAERARKMINEETPFYCVGSELKGQGGIYDVDLSRLMVNVSIAGYTGFFVERILRTRFKIYAEYADYCNVYFILTGGNTLADVARLISSLKRFGLRKKKLRPVVFTPDVPESAMSPQEAYFSPAEKVKLENAVGRIAKDALIPYPPGVPIICPGEVIQKQHVEIIGEIKKAGGYCLGIKNDFVAVVKNG